METSSAKPIILTVILLVIVEFVRNGNTLCLESDRRALIDLKSGLDDPMDRLSSWQGESCCLWKGISCDNLTGAVTTLDLRNPYPFPDGWELSGKIRPSLANLKSLRHLDLSFNTFHLIPIPQFLDSLENLQYLNLSNAGFRGVIPPSLGNLSRLQYLDLSSGASPLTVDNLDWVGGLESLKHLEMSGNDLSKVTSEWLVPLNKLSSLTHLLMSSCRISSYSSSLTSVNFTSLAVIDLSLNSFHSEIPTWLSNVSSLVFINLGASNFYGTIPVSFAGLPNLKILNLGSNDDLTANCSQLFKENWKKTEVIIFDFINLKGELPVSIGNMTSLRIFYLPGSGVGGGIPSSIGKLCNLIFIDLSENNLTKGLPDSLQGADDCGFNIPLPSLRNLILSGNQIVGILPEWLSQLDNLVVLMLQRNLFQGPIPASLGKLAHLSQLWIGENSLSGTLPESLGQLSELSVLHVNSNNLMGIVSERHFSKLSKLKSLDLSANSFILNVNSSWVPPFQVETLNMGSCRLGPSFPYWLKSQMSVTNLDFSNASISGPIPSWFWYLSGRLPYFNLSFNQLEGHLPNPLNVSPSAFIDLSFNSLRGSIPLTSASVWLLVLSNNKFSGPIPKTIGKSLLYMGFLSLSGNQLSGSIPASIGRMSGAVVLDLSNNFLSGRIPSSIGKCLYMQVLDLQNNNLSGELPESLGYLDNLQSLHLSDNKISGEIPSSFKNLEWLETLDLGNNSLTGKIPPWFGDSFPHLRILRLRLNRLSGELTTSLSNLSSLQVLDLAENEISGNIPSTLGRLKAMAAVQKTKLHLTYGLSSGSHYYEESLVVNLKNQTHTYTRTLSLLTSLDLSGNNLSGELPTEISKLVGLVALNLSRNHIHGQIPQSISRLHELSSLDLSDNSFSGPIPGSMSSLDFLGYLNLSNNNLSGVIPYIGHMTTFDASSFAGNPGLCGAPLTVKCKGDDSDRNKTIDTDSSNRDADKWILHLSIVLGFVAGICVPYTIIAIRRSWWDAYMCYVDKTAERLSHLGYKVAGLCRNKIKCHQ